MSGGGRCIGPSVRGVVLPLTLFLFVCSCLFLVFTLTFSVGCSTFFLFVLPLSLSVRGCFASSSFSVSLTPFAATVEDAGASHSVAVGMP